MDDPRRVDKLKKLASGLSTARKADRLFSSLQNVQQIFDILNDSKFTDIMKILAIIAAASSAYECYTDNVIFLSKIGYLQNVNTKAVGISGAKADCIGISIGLYLLYLKYNEEFDENTQRIQRAKFVGMICDLILAMNDSGTLEKIAGKSLNDGQYGVVGLLSATSVLYRCWHS